MTADDLIAALNACAAGFYPLEARVALLISNGTFLHRDDFTTRFIEHGTSISNGTTPMAAINWEAAVTALRAGELPCSGGERRIVLLSASLAGGIPIDLRDAVTGIDDANVALLVAAICHATGQHREERGPKRPSGHIEAISGRIKRHQQVRDNLNLRRADNLHPDQTGESREASDQPLRFARPRIRSFR
jgi:hypothetical protein